MKSITQSDITAFVEQINRQKQDWVDKVVFPYLVQLLNKAQSRLRTPIKFCDGMGTFTFCLDPEGSRRALEFDLICAITKPKEMGEPLYHNHLRRRFPELVEFCDIIMEIDDKLDESFGEILPTVRPRRQNANSHK